ncbi:LOW QUALITY PROTEIN: caspase-8-like [Lucilia sericata]|uniref:LOW QUALITY PROTEIN: caspase-8-like n=1 Tax=Lucilia sericata TaxID=13632 RepID=UPI0018A8461E|nr:LOW QUALITY PROTEIN: caspase-8-like [Lucilia sericata]
MSFRPKNIMKRIQDIAVEDLQYIETDLCYYQLVSLSFLLFGADSNAYGYILQKLIINNNHLRGGLGATGQLVTSGILTNYANINPETWRLHLVEALAIIRAKRVLRKLGLLWQEIYHHYLPHVAEISVYVHPLLKVLYKIAERLTPEQAGRLIHYIHTKYDECQHLRFYDYSYLEVFFLNWLTKGVIAVGNRNLENSNIQILIEFFKFNDMDSFKDLLLETINQQLDNVTINQEQQAVNNDRLEEQPEVDKDSGISVSHDSCTTTQLSEVKAELSGDFDAAERYKITKENAGYILIINQNTFYEETDPSLQHLLPEKKFNPKRNGTDIDRDRLKAVFSSYGYIPLVFNNLTHWEILHHIRETTKKSLLKDSIIICMLTHGMEGAVYGCNSIPVAIAEIKEILTADTLMGKPKMLLFQACQKHDPKVDTTSTKSIQKFSPDAYADHIVGYFCHKGNRISKRSRKRFLKYASIWRDILTAVTREISKKRASENDFMLPETYTTLRKELYLPA